MIIVFLRKSSHQSSEKAMAEGTRLDGMGQPIWSKDGEASRGSESRGQGPSRLRRPLAG